MENLTRRNFLQTAALAMKAESLAEAEPSHGEVYTGVYPLDGTDWLLDVDASNSGRDQGWANHPTTHAVSTKVPWVIQDAFPDYHGVAWYWREFKPPTNAHRGGQYLIRFQAVGYLGEVFVNGTRVGIHEGGEEPFTVNVTDAVRPGQTNLIAVRVLNPTHELLDGIRLKEVAEGRRDYPEPRDNAYNTGGITGSVDLLAAPPVRIEDLQVLPDWKTGELRIVAKIRNDNNKVVPARVTFAASPARESKSLSSLALNQNLKAGDTQLEATLTIPNHRLWELNDPFLYQVGSRIQAGGSESVDAYSVRCGFRDFRFEGGYFRLNGRRIYVHGALYTVLQYPISQTTPLDDDLLRRDVLNMKALGFNAIRITCGAALPRQLDLMDELGLLACKEHFGARELAATAATKGSASSPPPILLSEYGVCGAQHYARFLRNFEQLGKEHAADAVLFRKKYDLSLQTGTNTNWTSVGLSQRTTLQKASETRPSLPPGTTTRGILTPRLSAISTPHRLPMPGFMAAESPTTSASLSQAWPMRSATWAPQSAGACLSTAPMCTGERRFVWRQFW